MHRVVSKISGDLPEFDYGETAMKDRLTGSKNNIAKVLT